MASILHTTNDLQALRNQMNRSFSSDNEMPRIWAPAVDVAENEREIVLHAELPGMKKEEIDIQLSGDTLTLRGERKRESSTRSEHYHRLERQYGAWQRIFQIETPVEAQQVAASYENGVLTVRLPKQAAAQPRQIEIKSK